jgi:riboflavin-specific deaminase-like protein
MTLERLFDSSGSRDDAAALYTHVAFPRPGEARPYVYLNMVSTADGKIVVGRPGGPAKGVGGPTDQVLYRRLERNCDAVLIGSGTLRASAVLYPPELPRFVVTTSANLPFDNRFFTDAPDRAWVVVPEEKAEQARAALAGRGRVLAAGHGSADMAAILAVMRREMDISVLLCEGGATLNDDLVRAGLVDELFLTISPKLKGGAHLPTMMTGEGYAPGQYLEMSLLSLYREGDELYLRYRLDALPSTVPGSGAA